MRPSQLGASEIWTPPDCIRCRLYRFRFKVNNDCLSTARVLNVQNFAASRLFRAGRQSSWFWISCSGDFPWHRVDGSIVTLRASLTGLSMRGSTLNPGTISYIAGVASTAGATTVSVPPGTGGSPIITPCRFRRRRRAPDGAGRRSQYHLHNSYQTWHHFSVLYHIAGAC